MSIYLDTSLIVALLTNETHSAAAQAWLYRNNGDDLLASRWTTVEVASALQLKHQLGFLDEITLLRAHGRWQELVSDYLSLVEVKAEDFTATAGLYRDRSFNLRSGDALHVALAVRLESTLATLDRRMHEQARAMRMRTADILPN